MSASVLYAKGQTEWITLRFLHIHFHVFFYTEEPRIAPQDIALWSAPQPAFLRQTETCLAQFIVHWLQSERGEEGKNFAALRFYCTVTLAVYPSDLCIREHLSKRAVVSPVAISTSSSALSLIYTTKDERRNGGERRGLISIAAGVSRIRYARVWTRRKRRACQHPISGKRFVCRP